MLGIAGNSAIIFLYLLTRAVGVPLFGPEAGEVEEVGLVDVCATASEAAIVVAIGGMLRRVIRQSTVLEVPLLAGAVMLFDHLPHLVLHFFLL